MRRSRRMARRSFAPRSEEYEVRVRDPRKLLNTKPASKGANVQGLCVMIPAVILFEMHAFVLLRPVMLGALVVMSLIGCANHPTEFSHTSAIVYGAVRNSSGAPVPNAQVRVDALSTCSSTGPLTSIPVQTSPTGGYQTLITTIVSPQQICVRSSVSSAWHSRLGSGDCRGQASGYGA